MHTTTRFAVLGNRYGNKALISAPSFPFPWGWRDATSLVHNLLEVCGRDPIS